MAIVYITGAPGSGKSLWTLSTVRKKATDEKRQVYYYNIPGLNIPGWIELTKEQALRPHELPTGAIAIFDEAWELWPQSKAGVKVPEEIELFATHRHRGHDFFIITQRTTSVHHFIRGLIGQHVHFERQFGLPRARRFEWQRLGNPSDKWDKQAASGSEFIYPKEVYGWYKSSDQHTVKVKLPKWRLAAIAGGCVLVVFLIGSAFSRLSSFGEKQDDQAEAISDLGGKIDHATRQTNEKLAQLEAKLGAAEWSARFAERVPGVPMSASFYDSEVKPASVPRISGCSRIQINGVDSCRCTTQQGSTIRQITHAQCVIYVRSGWYDPLKEDEPEHVPGQQGQGAGAAGADSGAAAPPPAIINNTEKPSPGPPGGSASLF